MAKMKFIHHSKEVRCPLSEETKQALVEAGGPSRIVRLKPDESPEEAKAFCESLGDVVTEVVRKPFAVVATAEEPTENGE